MPDITRRSLAAGAGLLVGVMALSGRAQPQIATATAPKFRPQPLTFSPDKIKWLPAEVITAHHAEYVAAVNRLNAIAEQLAGLDLAQTPPSTIGELKREEHIVYNSTVFHELYFECLGEAPTRPSGVFAQALARDFGSLDRWKAEFAATAKALGGGGSGLVVLAYAPRDKRLFTHWAADYGMAPAACVPLLALDMYEHAYRGGDSADAGKYVDNFTDMIRWTTAERLYREAIRV